LHIARSSSFVPRTNVRNRVLPSRAIAPIAATIDAAVLLLASATATVLYRLYATDGPATPSGSFGVGLTAAFLFVLIARAQGLYRFQVLVSSARHLASIALLLAVTFLLLTFMLFLLKEGADYSRATIIIFAALAAVLAPAGRLAVGAAARAGIRSGAVRGRPASLPQRQRAIDERAHERSYHRPLLGADGAKDPLQGTPPRAVQPAYLLVADLRPHARVCACQRRLGDSRRDDGRRRRGNRRFRGALA
jgi:hypothetical protein